MSAHDVDDLFERVDRALDRDIPTVTELEAKLAAALDELERDFPDGYPMSESASPLRRSTARLRYRTLISDVQHCRAQLESGQCVEFARGRESHIDRSDPEWQAFLDAHPELQEDDNAR